MSKTRSMDEEDFWAPAVFGLIIAIIFLLILGALNFVIMENREIRFSEVADGIDYKEALFGAIIGQEFKQEVVNKESLIAARIIGRYLREQHAFLGQIFPVILKRQKEILQRREEQNYLRRLKNAPAGNDDTPPEVLVMASCPYWQAMIQGEGDRRIIEGLLSGKLKTVPVFERPSPPSLWYFPWWFYLVGLQVISFGIFLLWHIGEQHYAWYELPGGIPGRVAILTLYSPGAWPLFVLAGTLSLVIFLINEKEKRGRKRVEIKQNSQPAPAFSEDRSLLEKLQARLDTVIKGKKQ